MDDHFRAFSFVDSITVVQPGVRIEGRYTIPPGLDTFPTSLVAEAVGQLAAWSAMDVLKFERRPVAGIAGRIDLFADARPGQVLELSAAMESVDAEAASYCGTASADGIPLLRLEHCVGPMVPVVEFDDPAAVRERFALLCGPGAKPGVFAGVPPLSLSLTGGEPGQSARATLQVPALAPFFADHFPRRPVFPGSLLMHTNLQLAAALAGGIPPVTSKSRWKLRSVIDMKLRAFIPPGETLELEARLEEQFVGVQASACSPEDKLKLGLQLKVETRRGHRVVGAASVLIVPEESP